MSRRLLRLWLAADAQTKEARAVPFRAGDQLRNCREARIGRFLPKEAVGGDGDGIARAFIFTDQDGAGFETPVQFTRLLPRANRSRSLTVSRSRPPKASSWIR